MLLSPLPGGDEDDGKLGLTYLGCFVSSGSSIGDIEVSVVS